MDPGASWQLSRIWLWNKTDPEDIGPLAVLLSVGLYGVYMAVFSLSMWTMYWDGKRFSGVRWVVVVTFVVVTLYIPAMIMDSSYAVGTAQISINRYHLQLVADAWCNMSPCVCCSLSDSVLAWRCYVIFGKRRWLKWTLTIVVLVVSVSGLFASIIALLFYWKYFDGRPDDTLFVLLHLVEFPTDLTWAMCSLILNTVLSTSIVAKIVIVSRQTSRHFASSRSIPLARAFIESSLMLWAALAVYTSLDGSSYLSPNSVLVVQGKSALNAILPLIFSISQALVIARLGISRFAASTSFLDTIVALTSDNASAPRSRAVAHRDVELSSNQE